MTTDDIFEAGRAIADEDHDRRTSVSVAPLVSCGGCGAEPSLDLVPYADDYPTGPIDCDGCGLELTENWRENDLAANDKTTETTWSWTCAPEPAPTPSRRDREFDKYESEGRS